MVYDKEDENSDDLARYAKELREEAGADHVILVQTEEGMKCRY